jgi:hypothetical protein
MISVCLVVQMHTPETVWRSVDHNMRSTDNRQHGLRAFASQRHDVQSVVHEVESILHVPLEVCSGRVTPMEPLVQEPAMAPYEMSDENISRG